jgi:hypothetical protein
VVRAALACLVVAEPSGSGGRRGGGGMLRPRRGPGAVSQYSVMLSTIRSRVRWPAGCLSRKARRSCSSCRCHGRASRPPGQRVKPAGRSRSSAAACPARYGSTRSNASSAEPPCAVGPVSGPTTPSSSMTEPELCQRPAAVHRPRCRQGAPVPHLRQARHRHPRRTGRAGSRTGSDRQMIWRVRRRPLFAPPHPIATEDDPAPPSTPDSSWQ